MTQHTSDAITAERLEAEGWLNSLRGGYLKAHGGLTIKVWQGCSNWWFSSAMFAGFDAPTEVSTMSDIRQLLAVLRGTKESEASRD